MCECGGGGGGGGGQRRAEGEGGLAEREGELTRLLLPEFDHIFVKQRFVWDQRRNGMSSSQITAI